MKCRFAAHPIFTYCAFNNCIEKEFSTKYASKGEKMSSVARDVFTSILNETSSDSDSSRIIKKLIMKAVGQRDKGIREVRHQLLSINL